MARLRLSPGDAVLDMCCGAGASALPAARAVGPTGSVLGLDLAEPLLALAGQRAVTLGLSNVSFRKCDAMASELESGSFDAVVCVFGVFFAADMPGFVAEMWRLVRPGGTLAITTWGPDWCEPASSVFWASVRELAPRLFRAFNPWDEITTEAALAELLARGGVSGATIEATAGERHELDRPGDFWDIVLGSGLPRHRRCPRRRPASTASRVCRRRAGCAQRHTASERHCVRDCSEALEVAAARKRHARGRLPMRDLVRCAVFCCPTT